VGPWKFCKREERKNKHETYVLHAIGGKQDAILFAYKYQALGISSAPNF